LDWRNDGSQPAPYAQPPTVNTSLFRFAPGSLDEIKTKATPTESEIKEGSVKWISTNDALVAFIWRCILKARCPPGSQHKKESMVSVAIDGRRALAPSIPMSHAGNVVFCGLTELPIDFLTAETTTLSSIASLLRKSVQGNSDSKILSDAVKLASCIPDVRGLGNAFRSWFDEDLVTTSGISIPIYDLDFGPILGNNGNPEFFRMPASQFDGITSIQPRKKNGDVEVFISMSDEQMIRLRQDPEFSQYLVFISR